MTTYLVTGGAGFIGSHLVHTLVEKGRRVRVLDNCSTGSRGNLHPVLPHIEWIEGDIRDRQILVKAVEGVEVIFHQAALASVTRSLEDPATSHEVNATGTLLLLDAARRARVRRVVYASSSSIYGDTPTLPKMEEMTPQPKSPYAVSKFTGEQYCQVFAKTFDLETVCLRYFNVFGPRQDPNSPYAAVIPRFLSALLRKERPQIYGDGTQTRDFTFVQDVVEANLFAADAPAVAGEVLNIACGKRHSLLELVDTLNTILGTSLSPLFTDPRPGDILHSQASIAKAERLLRYHPRVDFREGLQKTADWFVTRL